MLKPLEIEYEGRQLSLECTHKKKFPPPQMYGLSVEDIDKMWKQGAIDQILHQSLTIWKDICGLYVMGPKCMTCPHALLQKPRLGRPHVIETENFLAAKRRMTLEDQKANYVLPPVQEQPEATVPLPQPKPRILTGNPDLGFVQNKAHQEFETIKAAFESEPAPEPDPEPVPDVVEQDDTPKFPLLEPDQSSPAIDPPTPEPTPEPTPQVSTVINDDLLDALADE